MSARVVIAVLGILVVVLAAFAVGEMSHQNCVDNARADHPIEEADGDAPLGFGRLERSTERLTEQTLELAIEDCDRVPW